MPTAEVPLLCEQLLYVEDTDQYTTALSRVATALECEYFGGFHLQEGAPAVGIPSQLFNFHNVPTQYESYSDPGAVRRDPVLQKVKRSSLPLAWDRSTYIAARCEDMWEEMSTWGMSSGVIAAMHLPRGQHYCLGLETSRRLSTRDPDLMRLTMGLSLLLPYAQAAAARLVAPESGVSTSISAREREALQWASAGKTAWETGIIMGIAESTVTKHLDSATRKLEAANKVHAIAKAIHLGMLD